MTVKKKPAVTKKVRYCVLMPYIATDGLVGHEEVWDNAVYDSLAAAEKAAVECCTDLSLESVVIARLVPEYTAKAGVTISTIM